MITVVCHSRGCPGRSLEARSKQLPRLLKRLDGSVFRAGDRVFITISVPHMVSERAEVQMGDGRKPRAKLV